MDSILTSIKKTLGVVESYTHFDSDLIMHINSTLSILRQIGVGPSEGFSIVDKTQTWNDYLSDSHKLEFVKSYIYMKVRLLFDPPASSPIIESIKQAISELEWRIQIEVDPPQTVVKENQQDD